MFRLAPQINLEVGGAWPSFFYLIGSCRRRQFLANDVGLEIRAAYGSSKDVAVYASVGLKADAIFIVGKIARKQAGLAQSLVEGKPLVGIDTIWCFPFCAHRNIDGVVVFGSPMVYRYVIDADEWQTWFQYDSMMKRGHVTY